MWCIGAWCGVLGVGVVYWDPVWCIGGQCGVLGLVWCTGVSVVYWGWCGVLGASVVCGVGVVYWGPVWCIGAQCSVWGTMETVEFCLQQQHDCNVDCL